jgi:hypothetical protein
MGLAVQKNADVIEPKNRLQMVWKGSQEFCQIPMRHQAIGYPEKRFIARSSVRRAVQLILGT